VLLFEYVLETLPSAFHLTFAFSRPFEEQQRSGYYSPQLQHRQLVSPPQYHHHQQQQQQQQHHHQQQQQQQSDDWRGSGPVFMPGGGGGGIGSGYPSDFGLPIKTSTLPNRPMGAREHIALMQQQMQLQSNSSPHHMFNTPLSGESFLCICKI
jgi:hypothetical protein